MGSELADPSPACHMARRRALRLSRPYQNLAGSWSRPVLIACSGGTDSAALVVLAAEALRVQKVAPFIVVHVDHQSRNDSHADADMVRALCRRFDMPFVATRTRLSGSQSGRSMEDVWRERRYEALALVCRQTGIDTIVTAHTRDDQVETVLMRLLSGSGRLTMSDSPGLSFSGRDCTILRPLLAVSRRELEDVLDLMTVRPLNDPSNADTTYRRNAVRQQMIPLIDSVFPGFDKALVRSAMLRDADGDFCDRTASDLFADCAEHSNSSLRLPRTVIVREHEAVSSRLVMLAAKCLIQGSDVRELSHERIHAVLLAATGRSGAVIELPYGVLVTIEREFVRFEAD